MIGRNVNINDSFRLQISNATSSPYTINLFNLGGGSNTQTSLTTSSISQNIATNLAGCLVNSVFVANGNFVVQDTNSSIIIFTAYSIGQTLAAFLATVNPYVDSFGNVGTVYIQPTPNDLTGTFYDTIFSTGTVTQFKFDNLPPYYQCGIFTTSYVTGNPFVQIYSPTSITYIQNSEVGNVYKIMGMDIYTRNKSQILKEIGYAFFDVNGNFTSIGARPTVDPYQENGASLHMVDVDNFDVSTNTQFQYTILPTTEVYLTFNYVKSSVTYLREFDQAFASELRMKYVTEQRQMESLLYRRGILIQ